MILSLSYCGLKDQEFLILIIKEYLARQIKEFSEHYQDYTFFKYPLAFFHSFTKKKLDDFYNCFREENDNFLLAFSIAKTLSSSKRDLIRQIDSEFEIDEGEIFIEKNENLLKLDFKSVNSYEGLFAFIGLDKKIGGTQKTLAFFREAHKFSYMQGYNFLQFLKRKDFSKIIDEIIIVIQWFISSDDRNWYLLQKIHEDARAIGYFQSYVFNGYPYEDEEIDEELSRYKDENSLESNFFLKNMLSQDFLVFFLMMIDPMKNGFEFIRKDHLKGIISPSINIHMIIDSYDRLWMSLFDVSQGKIVILQTFAIFYRLLKRKFSEKMCNLNICSEEAANLFKRMTIMNHIDGDKQKLKEGKPVVKTNGYMAKRFEFFKTANSNSQKINEFA